MRSKLWWTCVAVLIGIALNMATAPAGAECISCDMLRYHDPCMDCCRGIVEECIELTGDIMGCVEQFWECQDTCDPLPGGEPLVVDTVYPMSVAAGLVAPITVPATTWEEGAEAYAEYMCEGEGGVDMFDYEGNPRTGRVEVYVVCDLGLVVEGHFNCPMCDPV